MPPSFTEAPCFPRSMQPVDRDPPSHLHLPCRLLQRLSSPTPRAPIPHGYLAVFPCHASTCQRQEDSFTPPKDRRSGKSRKASMEAFLTMCLLSVVRISCRSRAGWYCQPLQLPPEQLLHVVFPMHSCKSWE